MERKGETRDEKKVELHNLTETERGGRGYWIDLPLHSIRSRKSLKRKRKRAKKFFKV